jgi:hypothetical protein
MLLLFNSWKGWELVYRHHVGVADVSNAIWGFANLAVGLILLWFFAPQELRMSGGERAPNGY